MISEAPITNAAPEVDQRIKSSDNTIKPGVRLGLDNPKHPMNFVFRDNVFDYIRTPIAAVPPISPNILNAMTELDNATRVCNEAYLSYLDTVESELMRRAEGILELGRMKRDLIFAEYSKPVPLNAFPSESSKPPVGTPVSAAAAPLPAGFGKRRGAGSSGGALKKPKTPVETPPLESTDLPSNSVSSNIVDK